MLLIRGYGFPAGLLYDVANHCWYRPEADGSVTLGMDAVAVALAGEILAYTPKRVGLEVEAGRSCAVIESGKWVGPVRCVVAGAMMAVNEALMARPSLANRDPYGAGWIARVMPADRAPMVGLLTGNALEAAYRDWMAAEDFPEAPS